MRVGLLSGSLGVKSANAAILTVAAVEIEAQGHEARAIGDIAAIPSFDPTKGDDAPESVKRFRAEVRSCDALLIAAPEYAAGVAGWVKNCLDWLVGDSTLYRKVVGVASAGTTGGSYAIEQLVRTVSWQGGWVVATVAVAAPRTKSDDAGVFTESSTLADIQLWSNTVVDAAQGTGARRAELLTSVVAPYGIDPDRFGEID